MIEIKYFFSEEHIQKNMVINEVSLRYELFLGSLIFKNGSQQLFLDWNWIPILDFALCLLKITSELSESPIENEKEFDFTESDERIKFEKNESIIKISFSFSNEIFESTIEDLQNVSHDFYKKVVFDILKKNNGIENDLIFSKYLMDAKKYRP